MDKNADRYEIAILDYGMGNLRSVLRAWEAVGASAKIISDRQELEGARALVFPGQGAIQDTIQLLHRKGWDDVIRKWISADKPFFGICLGLQALYEHSEEGDTSGLGIFKGRVKRFHFDKALGLKVPHMGWNTANYQDKDSFNVSGLADSAYYFVHSYYVENDDPELLWASTEYGPLRFCSAIQKGNLIATQFHPEKSQETGLALYRQFLEQIVRK